MPLGPAQAAVSANEGRVTNPAPPNGARAPAEVLELAPESSSPSPPTFFGSKFLYSDPSKPTLGRAWSPSRMQPEMTLLVQRESVALLSLNRVAKRNARSRALRSADLSPTQTQGPRGE
jgi:hypothetical protein